jgi:hypothetical protein
MVWLRFAVPLPETIKDDWQTMNALERADLAHTVRQAAEDTLRQILGEPMPVIGDDS